jgi:probable DNA metabolism protein
MARLISLPSDADFAAWRGHARDALLAGLAPSDIVWAVAGSAQSADLFGFAEERQHPAPSPSNAIVPRGFLELAQNVICHEDQERFALLYRLLWRLQRDRHLLQVAADPDVHRAESMAKAVRRDKHKMTAFVRFREIALPADSRWVAWFEPQHHIVAATAPFFVRRFASMRWSILTPRRCAHWDGTDLIFTTGAARSDAPDSDAAEDHWRTYFAAIFNPARLNVAAMQREMPKKYWANMPEADLIPGLVRDATRRTGSMLASPATTPRLSAADREAVPMRKPLYDTVATGAPPADLAQLTSQLNGCRNCPLWRDATQPVPGRGPARADIMLVGEQPGDQEDLQGMPFVGPAGRLLDGALEAAGLPRQALYVTNAVKHFKFEPRGKRRLHKRPDASEIDRCRWWLANEIKLVQPKLIVALGATAATSLLNRSVKISAERGQPLTLPEGPAALVTVHPSYLLRLPDRAVAEAERERFITDLRLARRMAANLGASLAA